jgi:KUP system potassium uptake protein
MVPSWLLWPLIALATAATVIASQALISGAFSLTMQGVQMGYVPFINIRHTSREEHGQIYISQINTLLAFGCIALVIGFKSSDALASAYGIAVTLTMVATTLPALFCGSPDLEMEHPSSRGTLRHSARRGRNVPCRQ